MIARLIEAGYRDAASGGFGMKRQIFFCQVGGYDTYVAVEDVGCAVSFDDPEPCCGSGRVCGGVLGDRVQGEYATTSGWGERGVTGQLG